MIEDERCKGGIIRRRGRAREGNDPARVSAKTCHDSFDKFRMSSHAVERQQRFLQHFTSAGPHRHDRST